MVTVTLSVETLLTGVTLGVTSTATPSTMPSLGVRVKAGKSLPAFTKSKPAAVKVTLPRPSRA